MPKYNNIKAAKRPTTLSEGGVGKFDRDRVSEYRKNDLILIMTPDKQDKTLQLSKHWSADSTPARNEMIMKTSYSVKSVKCDKICSNDQEMYAVMRNWTSR